MNTEYINNLHKNPNIHNIKPKDLEIKRLNIKKNNYFKIILIIVFSIILLGGGGTGLYYVISYSIKDSKNIKYTNTFSDANQFMDSIHRTQKILKDEYAKNADLISLNGNDIRKDLNDITDEDYISTLANSISVNSYHYIMGLSMYYVLDNIFYNLNQTPLFSAAKDISYSFNANGNKISNVLMNFRLETDFIHKTNFTIKSVDKSNMYFDTIYSSFISINGGKDYYPKPIINVSCDWDDIYDDYFGDYSWEKGVDINSFSCNSGIELQGVNPISWTYSNSGGGVGEISFNKYKNFRYLSTL